MGTHTTLVIERLLDHYKVEQQAFNGCLSILKLTDKYTEKQLESVCEQADDSQQPINQPDTSQHDYLRGQDYYGKKV